MKDRPASRGARRLLAVLALALLAPAAPLAQTTTTYSYDALGRLTRTQDEVAGLQTRPVAYEYDKAGNRTEVSNGAGAQEYPVSAFRASSSSGQTSGLNPLGMADGRVGAANTVHLTQGEASAWIEADLGAPKLVDEIDLAAGNVAGLQIDAARTNGAVVEYSNDQTNWSPAPPITVTGVAVNAYRTVSVGGVNARYWRVRKDGPLALGEFRLFSGGRGSGSAAAPAEFGINAVNLQVVSGGSVSFRPLDKVDGGAAPVALLSWTQGARGSVTANPADGRELIYSATTPGEGQDTFQFSVQDANHVDLTGEVTVTILAVGANRAPVAALDLVSAYTDIATIFFPLANDSDPDHESIRLLSVAQPPNGAVTANMESGAVVYRANVGFTGQDSFSYVIADARGAAATGQVLATVAAPPSSAPAGNRPPYTVADNISATPDIPITFDPLLNDFDPNNDTFHLVSVSPPSAYGATRTYDTATGLVTYRPWFGGTEPDTLTYVVADTWGAASTGTINITVSANNAPTPVADNVMARPGIAKTFDPRENDTDPNDDPLTITATGAPSHGSVTVLYGRALTYTAAAGYLGPDSFTYTVSDGRGGQASATVSVTVQTNLAPSAVDDLVTAPAGGYHPFDPLANDIDPDDDALTVTGVSTPSHGGATIAPGGKAIIYTPAAGYVGADSLSYTISDGHGGVASAQVSIDVATGIMEYLIVGGGGGGAARGGAGGGGGGVKTGFVTLPPGAIAVTVGSGGIGAPPLSGTFNGGDGGASSLGAIASVLGGGGGVGGGPGRPGASGGGAGKNQIGPAAGGAGTAGQGHAGGASSSGWEVGSTGSAAGGGGGAGAPGSAGTPTQAGAGGAGVSSSISGTMKTYGAGGGAGGYFNGQSASAGAAGDDSASAGAGDGSEDGSAPGGYHAADASAYRGGGGGSGGYYRSGDVLTQYYGAGGAGGGGVAILRYPGPPRSLGGTVTQAGGYTVHTFTSSSTFTVQANTAPVAVDDTISAPTDGSWTFDPRSNDTDADSDALYVTAVGAPAHGVVTIGGGGASLTYVPAAGYVGSDSFTYTVGDGRGGTATANVSATVAGANAAPVAVDDQLVTSAPMTVTFDPRANDSDADGDPLTVTAVGTPAHGVAAIIDDGAAISYTATGGYVGPDSFSYTIGDGRGGSASASLSVTVQARIFAISPAVNGRSNWNLDVDGPLNLGTAGTWTLTPQATFVTQTKAWGGGGGGWSASGGGGGYAAGLARYQAGVGYTLYVGGAGGGWASRTGGAPGGGAPAPGDGVASGGGGWTGVHIGSQAKFVLVAGGGGGAGWAGAGGAGGGAAGESAPSFYGLAPGGVGGTQSTSGGSPNPANVYGGGGGGGYKGGGAGVKRNDEGDGGSGGGGGSGHVDPVLVTGASLIAGSGATPGSSADPERAGAGETGSAQGSAGRLILAGVVTANALPVAVNDSGTTTWQAPLTLDPRANDSDANGDTLTVTAVGTPAHGTAAIIGGTSVRYTPTAGYIGSDSFSYTIADGRSGTATAMVNITVTDLPPNTNPNAVNDTVVVVMSTATTIDPKVNDTDAELDPLTVTAVGTPSHGTATIVSGGAAVLYTPTAAYLGADSFSYTINDGRGGTATASVNVTVVATVQYLIVAGGGGGGSSRGGGGGGGGVVSGSTPLSPGAYPIVVGGAGGSDGNGGNSTALGVTANGGGRGDRDDGGAAGAGGSGGGGGGAGIAGQGHAGGARYALNCAGGGGGAGGLGGNASQYYGGAGGAGLTSAIDGSSQVYGSGGGGGCFSTPGPGGTNAGNGVAGGGVGGVAVANRGGGGGGGGLGNAGGAGGSGVVVFRYVTGSMSATGGTVSTSGAYTVHVFTSSGALTIN